MASHLERSVLRIPDVRLLVTAVGLSAVGDFLLWVPLALHLEAATGSALVVSAFFLALFGPSVALAGVAGRLADRVENVRLLVVVSLLQAVVAAAMALVADSTGAVLALTGLLGAGAALGQPAEFALVPAAAGEARVREANGLVETARYAGMTAGPVLGGLLAAAGRLELALVLDAVSFLAVAACTARLHARRRPQRLAGDGGRLRDGIAHVTADPALRATLAAAIAALAFFSMSIAAEVLYVKDVLRASDAAYGAIMSCWTLGMVAGATGVARRVPARRLAAAALAAVAVQGAGITGAALGGALWAAFAGFALGGMAHGAKNVFLRTLIHERVPDALRGRAFAAYGGARNAAELCALGAAGAVVGLVGAQAALALSGLVPLAIGLAALLHASRPPTSLRDALAR